MAGTLPDAAFARSGHVDSPVLLGSPCQSPVNGSFDPNSSPCQSPMERFFEPREPAFFAPEVAPPHVNSMTTHSQSQSQSMTPNMAPQAVSMGSWPCVGYMQVVFVPTTANLVSTDQAGLLAASSDLTAAQVQPVPMQADVATRCARSQASSSIDRQDSQASSESATKGKQRTSKMWSKGDQNRKNSPHNTYQSDSSGSDVEAPKPTTLMLKNLPNDYTREMMLQLLDENGFKGRYNFVYLPMDFKRWAGLGYAFVNMVTNKDAEDMIEKLNGFTEWTIQSAKVLQVTWGDQGQGIDAQIHRYRNSPVMHPDLPEESRPLLFENGVRVDFPPPTKNLRPPRVKKWGGSSVRAAPA